jgi:Ca2+-transporting ATPase
VTIDAARAESDAAGDADAYRHEVDDVLDRLETTPAGLTSAQAAAHRAQFGSNEIVTLKRESTLRRYLRQYKDWMIVLLLASATVTAVLGDYGTAAVLIVLVAINTLIGFVQENRAEKTMEALETLVAPSCQVYRDGALNELDSRDLVVGDVVRLTEGVSVPADVRLIESVAFATNEFALTGESDPTRKHARVIPHEAPVADRHNMAYAATTVATGEATGIVVATGMHTELGKIARLSQSATAVPSPLQREMARIATYVTYGVTVLTLIVLVITVQSDLPFTVALLFAVGFACALIPQGLPAEVNTALASAASTLAKQRVLVKKLSAVETLGSTHVICTDKTGTLTKNEMTVTELVVAGVPCAVSGIGYEPTGTITPAPTSAGATARLHDFLSVGVLASNAKLVPPSADAATWRIFGDPTEGALLVATAKAGIDLAALAAEHTEVGELPFDSTRKVMTSIRRDSAGGLTAYSKGSPESILERATHISVSDDSAPGGTSIRPITAVDLDVLLAHHTEKADRALRNLLYARRTLSEGEAESDDLKVIETGLTVLGMVSMVDPIRTAVPDAMAAALAAGVTINIITGDFSLTAIAIARQAGLAPTGDALSSTPHRQGTRDDGLTVITGAELATLSDAEVLAHALRGGTVFSRVAPEDKVRIVDLLKASGSIVAVTGDGINDAPALRHANIGVAMGASGTDVAKQAAEVVLLDDSFASLIGAVRQGRTIYQNIRKGVLSCLTSNFAEFVVNSVSLALFSLLGVPLALNVLQILAIDLLGEIFPIAALGRDPEEGETMKQKPRDAATRILNRRSLLDIAIAGALIGSVAVANYLFFYTRHGVDPFSEAVPTDLIAPAMTITYVTIMVCQLVSITQRRSVHGLFTRYQLANRTYWLAVLVAIGIMLVIVYVPFVAAFFGTAPLTLIDWALVVAAAVLFLAIREGGRLLTRGRPTIVAAAPAR